MEQAYQAVFELAEKNQVGFFDASSDGAEVWLPSGDNLLLAHKQGFLERVGQLFGKKT